MDYHAVIDRDKDDFLINLAILKRAYKDATEEKAEEYKALSKLIAVELANVLGMIMR